MDALCCVVGGKERAPTTVLSCCNFSSLTPSSSMPITTWEKVCVCVCVCVCGGKGGREEQRVKQMECTFQCLVNIIRGKAQVRRLRPAQALLFPELSSNVSLTILNCIYTFRELM